MRHWYCSLHNGFAAISDEWSSPEVTGQTALPCSRFTLTNDGKKAIMFGGWNGSTMADDLFIVNLEKNSVVRCHTIYTVYIGTMSRPAVPTMLSLLHPL